jgi:hypothetical protein
MLKIDNKNIYLTRGDIATIEVNVTNDDGTDYEFKSGDTLVFSIKKDYTDTTALLRKTINTEVGSTVATISLTTEDTTIGDLIKKPVKYVYDIALNGNMTVIGYDEEGSKYFYLYPEASNDE